MAAWASFKTVNDSISSGFMLFIEAIYPSTTTNGSLSELLLTPRISTRKPLPGEPEDVVTETPEALP